MEIALADRTIILEKNYDVPEEFYYQALTDVKDYQITFSNYVKSVETSQNTLGNFADIGASGQGIGINIKIQYSADPTTRTFSALVTEGDYRDTKMKNDLTKTLSFDGKNPTGATKVQTELKLRYGLFSPLVFFGDESIKFGMEQALDKVADRAKILQKNSRTQHGSTPIQLNPISTNPPTKESLERTDASKPPVIPEHITPVKFPTIVLYSPSVNGMSATLNGSAQSDSGKILNKILIDWGDSQSSIGPFPHTHTYLQTGTYHITAKVTDNGLSSSTTTNIVISSTLSNP
jgi:hypothetical protein